MIPGVWWCKPTISASMHLLDDIFYLKSHLQCARKVGVKFKHSYCRLPMHVNACDYWLPPASLLWFMYLTLNLGAGRLWWAFMGNDEIKHQSQNDHHHQNQTLCSTQQQISAILEDTGCGICNENSNLAWKHRNMALHKVEHYSWTSAHQESISSNLFTVP